MAIFARFWNFPKRENSTQIPTDGDTGFGFTINIVGESSVISPTITLRENNPYNTNYCYIPEFERYYFVRNWSYTAQTGLWTASLECDTLASFKSEIGNSTQYILRSAAAFDGDIMDMLYPTKSNIDLVRTEISLNWIYNITSGTYVVGIINTASDRVGAVSYYTFSQSEFENLSEYLMGNTDWLNINTEEISQELLKALFNPFQYITSCMWFPFSPTEIQGDLVVGIPFGWWGTTVSAHKLPINGAVMRNFNAAIPKHPDASVRGNYLNLSPFSKYDLYIPPFGNIPLDSTKLEPFTNLLGTIYVDLMTGMAMFRLNGISEGDDSNVPITYVSAQIGVQIQLAQIVSDTLGMAVSAIETAGNTIGNAMQLNVGGAISSLANGIYSTIQAGMPQVKSGGTNGSRLYCIADNRTQLNAQFFRPVEDSVSHRGRPLCQERVINTLPGYIMCSDTDLSISGTAEECRQIKDYMNNGFYWE